MSFRDDREAAHRRADALEQQLEETRAELAALKHNRPPRGRMAAVIAGLVAAASALGATSYLVMRGRTERVALAQRQAAEREAQLRATEEAQREAATRAERAAAEIAAETVRRQSEQARREAELAEANAPTRTLTWPGRDDQGRPCALEAQVGRVGSRLLARSVVFRCGETERYRATPEALRRDVALREGTLPNGTHVYLFNFTDQTRSDVQVHVSTLRHELVMTGASTDGGADYYLRDVSDPVAGEALGVGRSARGAAFGEVVDRTARVTRVEGRTGVARGDRCTFQVRPVWEYPESCRVALRCGRTWLYGANEAGYLTCEVRDGRPVAALDENTTSHGGDPRVTWRGSRITVSDFTESGAWSVELGL